MTGLSENISVGSVTVLPKLVKHNDPDGDWGTKSESQ